MAAFARPHGRSDTIGPLFDYFVLAPAAAAICYLLLLRAPHSVVGTHARTPSHFALVGATLILSVAFIVPFALACRADADPEARRLAYASVAAPTLYVGLGVVQVLADSPVADEIMWCVLCLTIAIWSRRNSVATTRSGRRALAHRPRDDGGGIVPVRGIPSTQSPVWLDRRRRRDHRGYVRGSDQLGKCRA